MHRPAAQAGAPLCRYQRSVHDSQKLDDLLDPANTASTVWADSAYRSKDAEEKLAARGFKSRIHRRGNRGKPLTARQEAANKTRSSVRARVEHVFGSQHTSMGGKLVRTIGIARAKMKVGMQNLAYNMRRLVVLDRAAPVAAQRPESAIPRPARPDRQENYTRIRCLMSKRLNIGTSGPPSAPQAASGNPKCQLFEVPY